MGSRVIRVSSPNSDLPNVLTALENQDIPDPYKGYYTAKRTNFHASIQRSPELWRLYLLADSVLLNEFEDLFTAHDPNRMLPLSLFFNAHAKIRVSMELAFTRCMEESRSIMRDAIETAAFARYMDGDEELQRIWLNKDEGKEAEQLFAQNFQKDKRTKLFKGIPELYARWSQLSETGAHSTPQAIVSRFKIEETANSIRFMMAYTGIEDREWEPETFTLILVVSLIEKTIFDAYSQRLQFDENLLQNRQRMDQWKEELRAKIIKKHNIAPPKAKSE